MKALTTMSMRGASTGQKSFSWTATVSGEGTWPVCRKLETHTHTHTHRGREREGEGGRGGGGVMLVCRWEVHLVCGGLND